MMCIVPAFRMALTIPSLTVLSNPSGAPIATTRSPTFGSSRVSVCSAGMEFPALQTETLDDPKVGDRVVAIGAPLGLESTVSEGIVSAIRNAGTMHIIQTTASISPGSSGGPLLNEYGKVIGLTTSTVLNGQSLNFVVSARHISELLSRDDEIE